MVVYAGHGRPELHGATLQLLQSFVRVWWRTVLVFVLLVLFVNIVISFLLAKFYPSHCVRTSLHIQSPHVQRESLYILEDPRQLYLHVDTPLLPLAEKDVIVRSAYVRLSADAGYKNSTVILLEVKKRLVDENAFEGCGVGRYASTTFEVYSSSRLFQVLVFGGFFFGCVCLGDLH